MSQLTDDGDLIRGLGYVTVYAGYVEEALNGCVEAIYESDEKEFKKIMRQPSSEKIKAIKKTADASIQKWTNPENKNYLFKAEKLRDDLTRTKDLLEQRNLVTHAAIYAEFSGSDIRKSNRLGIPPQKINSAELYDLANNLFVVHTHLENAYKDIGWNLS